MDKNTLWIENADIKFRNFEGKEGQYNRAGDRNFCVFVDEKKGQELEDQGWNIKWKEPRNEGDERKGCLQISVKYGAYPPEIYMIIGKKQTKLDEESVKVLDTAELENVDLVIRPYHWEVNGRSGVKAYLQRGYFTIIEDIFYKKYNNVEDDEVPF